MTDTSRTPNNPPSASLLESWVMQQLSPSLPWTSPLCWGDWPCGKSLESHRPGLKLAGLEIPLCG